jgi:hypothetical protein
VRGQGTRPAALAAAVLLAGALGACGGSDSSTSESASGSTSTQSRAGQSGGKESKGGAGGGAKESGGEGNGGSGGEVETEPLEVSGGGSSQYRVKGGDNSVQEFGEESDESELEEAATALHDYLVARAEEDWPAACANLARSVKGQLGVLASRSEKLKDKGCAETLATLTPRLPASVRRESTIVDAGSLRVEGDQSFLIYRGADGATYAVLMVPEDGWKVGSLGATPLS